MKIMKVFMKFTKVSEIKRRIIGTIYSIYRLENHSFYS